MWGCVELGDAGIPRDIVVIIFCRAWHSFQKKRRHVLEGAVLAKLGANLGVQICDLSRQEKIEIVLNGVARKATAVNSSLLVSHDAVVRCRQANHR